jgi:hypothetical protein
MLVVSAVTLPSEALGQVLVRNDLRLGSDIGAWLCILMRRTDVLYGTLRSAAFGGGLISVSVQTAQTRLLLVLTAKPAASGASRLFGHAIDS